MDAMKYMIVRYNAMDQAELDQVPSTSCYSALKEFAPYGCYGVKMSAKTCHRTRLHIQNVNHIKLKTDRLFQGISLHLALLN